MYPIAEALKEKYFNFASLLRHEAFQRFSYDPVRVFSENIDEQRFGERGLMGIPRANLLNLCIH